MSATMQRPMAQVRPTLPTRVPNPQGVPQRGPAIRLVPPRQAKKKRPKFFYASVAFGTIIGVIATQLILSVILSSGAYEIAELQSQARELSRTEQARTQDLDRLNSPQNLASNAEALGMVANNTPVYLRLSDGATLGEAVAASPDAGVIAGSNALVANSLLANVPLVTDIAAEKARTEQLKNSSSKSTGTGSANTSSATSGTGATKVSPIVPLTDGLPGVSTR